MPPKEPKNALMLKRFYEPEFLSFLEYITVRASLTVPIQQ
jgi:hypothetical protein